MGEWLLRRAHLQRVLTCRSRCQSRFPACFAGGRTTETGSRAIDNEYVQREALPMRHALSSTAWRLARRAQSTIVDGEDCRWREPLSGVSIVKTDPVPASSAGTSSRDFNLNFRAIGFPSQSTINPRRYASDRTQNVLPLGRCQLEILRPGICSLSD